MIKKLAILGSTGSIGKNALKIVEAQPDRFTITSLVAGQNIDLLATQIKKFRPKLVSVKDKSKAAELRSIIGLRTKIVYGAGGLIEAATHPDIDLLLSAMVGAAGLPPTFAAIQSGIDVALANKEVLVVAGELVMREARKHKVKIIPVDSEHSAIFQAMRGEKKKEVRRLIITASGGPFRLRTQKELANVTIAEALKHPNWSMGPKITIDSATMMNKGLEVIEARWLFAMPPDKIEVLVHPESLIHSMVEFCDSSVIAQLGLPDMSGPIAYALNYPHRIDVNNNRLDLGTIGKLTFFHPDTKKFPAIDLAYHAIKTGGSAPATLNAANEIAVETFLAEKIPYIAIVDIVQKTLEQIAVTPVITLADALHADQRARRVAAEIIAGQI